MFSLIFKIFFAAALLWSAKTSVRAEDICPEIEVVPGAEEYVLGDVVYDAIYSTFYFYVYEDCPNGEMIFRVNGADFNISECNGLIAASGESTTFGFQDVRDAEGGRREQSCNPFLTHNVTAKCFAHFTFVDVNEYPPEPASGLSNVESLYVPENETGTIFEFSFKDLDFGETEGITCTTHFEGDAVDTFVIEQLGFDEQNGEMLFLLNTKKNLDYEEQTFYNLQAEFQSNDTRGNSSSVSQTFLIFVQDVGDNPPIFIKTEPPFPEVEEEEKGKLVFQVEAQDRDITINNKIWYSIISGNEDEFFEIEETTGQVYTSSTKRIDRENITSTTFALEIQAMEVLDDGGTPAPDQETRSQVTNVKVIDINDNIPQLNLTTAEEVIDEFDETKSQVSKMLNMAFTITDMDEGPSGEYEVTTNNTNVILNPEKGTGLTTFSITLLESDNFDYEIQANNPDIAVVIMAKEKENPKHTSTGTVIVNLTDINDNAPKFDQDEYNVSVNESIPGGTDIMTVAATDDDIDDLFNEKSLVYSLSNCGDTLTIDEKSGQISLSKSAELNYEAKTKIECMVRVTDMEGLSPNSLTGEAYLTINITDVNDESPVFHNFENSVLVEEGTPVNYVVAEVQISDPDTTASLEVSLEYVDKPGPLVERWFELLESENSTANDYRGTVVIKVIPDRETADEVEMNLRAIDLGATDDYQQTVETLKVIIQDVNDETPEFVEDYSSRNLDENTPKNTVVFLIEATDPDLEDEITYSLDDPQNYLKINETTGEVSVKTEVDRENETFFTVNAYAEDLGGHMQVVEINITVMDMNDNSPILDKKICDFEFIVPENSPDGTFVTTVKSTDEDEGVHAEISYILKNSYYVGTDFQFAPFAIEESSGDITVKTKEIELDREQRSEWPLIIGAYDHCDIGDTKCEVLSDECRMTVSVKDENDNAPGDFRLNEGTTISTDEALKKGTIIPNLEIRAFDPDQPNSLNSTIDFEVISMSPIDGEPSKLLFEAITRSWINAQNITEFYCELEATTDLTGLRGDYIIEINAADEGTPQKESSTTFSLTIEDVNDMFPQFGFSDCLVKSNTTINMKENITLLNIPLNCSSEHGSPPADIFLTDDDKPNTNNSEVELFIDYGSSSAEDGGKDNQLTAFDIFHYEKPGQFAIYIKEKIDRERGSKYNLTLIARDKGSIPNETPSWIYIIVEDFHEFPPTFCGKAPCEENLEIKENSVTAMRFKEAEDLDNSDEEINDVIYYEIFEDFKCIMPEDGYCSWPKRCYIK